ncbi:hypothetical protein JCGZ_04305 [Jatropha curcas]|uniref:Uncharacterized protein n=1 Tax=Jatropha curcas TaxID=180498 RepID=A0A067L1L9_JATCU|nr:hypothetical protein JCGZ_04305 [Jatropha curcas]
MAHPLTCAPGSQSPILADREATRSSPLNLDHQRSQKEATLQATIKSRLSDPVFLCVPDRRAVNAGGRIRLAVAERGGDDRSDLLEARWSDGSGSGSGGLWRCCRRLVARGGAEAGLSRSSDRAKDCCSARRSPIELQ